MKSYTITVNGVAYDVTVEEGAGNAVAASAPKAAPKAAPNLLLVNKSEKQQLRHPLVL